MAFLSDLGVMGVMACKPKLHGNQDREHGLPGTQPEPLTARAASSRHVPLSCDEGEAGEAVAAGWPAEPGRLVTGDGRAALSRRSWPPAAPRPGPREAALRYRASEPPPGSTQRLRCQTPHPPRRLQGKETPQVSGKNFLHVHRGDPERLRAVARQLASPPGQIAGGPYSCGLRWHRDRGHNLLHATPPQAGSPGGGNGLCSGCHRQTGTTPGAVSSRPLKSRATC
jgi:hypothetical protein